MANAVQHSEETLQSLQFGSRAMRVQTQAVVNECLDFKVTPLAPQWTITAFWKVLSLRWHAL